MIKQICAVCGKTFLTYSSLLKSGRGKTCSQQCGNELRRKATRRDWQNSEVRNRRIIGLKQTMIKHEYRQKMREIMLMKGKDPEYRKAVSKGVLEAYKNPVYRQKRREKVKIGLDQSNYDFRVHAKELWSKGILTVGLFRSEQNIKQAREHAIYSLEHGLYPKTDTSIEQLLEAQIRLKQLPLRHNKRILNMVPDFSNEQYRIAVYADGDYWHTLPKNVERDRKQEEILEQNGYKIMRFWEHEIKSNPQQCAEAIENTLIHAGWIPQA
jgi:DNA mismatch endonuclease (patch repair protein)